MARRDNRGRQNRGGGAASGNAGDQRNRNRSRNPKLKVGYTDLEKHGDGTYSCLLTAEVSGGDGSEQVQFFIDLWPKGTEVSVDEFGHAQLRVAGLSGNNHIVKAMLVKATGETYGPPSTRAIDLTKSPKLPDKLHARPVGRGRAFVPVAVNAQDGSAIKGALVDIYEAGEVLDTSELRREVPLFSGETDSHGRLSPVPCFDVSIAQDKRRLLVHVAGTRLEAFVVCRARNMRAPKLPASTSRRVALEYKRKFPILRSVRAFLQGISLGNEALRRQREGGVR